MTRGDPALVLPGLRARGLATAPVAVNPSVPPLGSGVPVFPDAVGSDARLQQLGNGGVEDDAEALR